MLGHPVRSVLSVGGIGRIGWVLSEFPMGLSQFHQSALGRQIYLGDWDVPVLFRTIPVSVMDSRVIR